MSRPNVLWFVLGMEHLVFRGRSKDVLRDERFCFGEYILALLRCHGGQVGRLALRGGDRDDLEVLFNAGERLDLLKDVDKSRGDVDFERNRFAATLFIGRDVNGLNECVEVKREVIGV